MLNPRMTGPGKGGTSDLIERAVIRSNNGIPPEPAAELERCGHNLFPRQTKSSDRKLLHSHIRGDTRSHDSLRVLQRHGG